MKYKFSTIFIFVSLIAFNLHAQDTLYLYTKPDCSVCKQTKQVLYERNISFIEKDVTSKINATEMLSKLAHSGFKSSIYMPVIYIGKKLMHPAYVSEKGLLTLDINTVVDSIIKQSRQNKLVQVLMQKEQHKSNNVTTTSNSDCEHETNEILIIAANYPIEKEAIGAVQILIKNGYPNAGFISDHAIYRVYLNIYPNFKSASTQLSIEKFKFTDAYLFELNKKAGNIQ